MNIKTDSIIELLEMTLNKYISEINLNDLDTITYLRVNKVNMDSVLNVDSSDLLMFKNLKEISIEKCMIDNKFLENLKTLTSLEKISFIHCDFVDEPKEYFDNLVINELVLNDVIGLDNILLSNIKKLILINCSFKCLIENIKVLDISRSFDIDLDINSIHINELVISEKQLEKVSDNLSCKIIIKNEYDKVLKVINDD